MPHFYVADPGKSNVKFALAIMFSHKIAAVQLRTEAVLPIGNCLWKPDTSSSLGRMLLHFKDSLYSAYVLKDTWACEQQP